MYVCACCVYACMCVCVYVYVIVCVYACCVRACVRARWSAGVHTCVRACVCVRLLGKFDNMAICRAGGGNIGEIQMESRKRGYGHPILADQILSSQLRNHKVMDHAPDRTICLMNYVCICVIL